MFSDKKNFTIIWLFIVISSVISGFILYFDFDKPYYYKLLPLLPFVFGLINLFFLMLYRNILSNIALTLVIGLYYIRFVIVPLIMMMGNYSSFLKFNISSNINYGIVLMVYELIIVYVVMYYSERKHKKANRKIHVKFEGKKLPSLFRPILMCLLFFCIIILIAIPESRQLYSSLFTSLNKTSVDIVSIDSFAERGGLKRALLTLYGLTMEVIRLLIPAYIIIFIRKKIGNKITGIMLSIPIVLAQFLLVSNTHARSIICAVILILLLAKLYPDWSKKLYKISFLFGLLFVLIYFTTKINSPISNSSNTGLEYASEIANAYFSGPDNIAATFNVESDEQIKTLIYTLVSAIPFNGTIFGLSGNNYSALYNNFNMAEFQIGPLISESYYYLGAIFAPIISAVIVVLAIKYGNKAKYETNIWKYIAYIYLVIILAASLVMYNGTILMKTVTGVIIPLLIVANLTSKRAIKND
ncbi:oligosaccharide repeat unit polymerase [Bhargavaea beijingensis]|uniref:Oligosaccharide repeat unit polymerase n=1 Tax=Bhargavaea beijingensis TaxID=426756 RepID=A0ABX9ZDI6_9BACL|nr:oligosaccharide repeat unit polymerase [Bhargavaea beijingensis]RSK33697.1 oligosaccharide repeat unit polymerase [Bhargavaea beijingensis]